MENISSQNGRLVEICNDNLYPSRKTKKRCIFVNDCLGDGLHDLSLTFKSVESLMTRKARILTHERLRNEIPMINPGDKPYKFSECETAFFKQGGLIPGSSIRLRNSARPNLRRSDTYTARIGGVKLSRQPYDQKVKEIDMKQDINEVYKLNNRTEVFGRVVPSWEDQTDRRIVDDDGEDED